MRGLELREEMRKVVPKAAGRALYRSAMSLALLTTAFAAFPEHKTVIALALLTLNQAVSALADQAQIRGVLSDYEADLAERQTRHTIFVAQQLTANGEVGEESAFWASVKGSVKEELDAQYELDDQKTSRAMWAWGVGSRFGLQLICDVGFVAAALILSGLIAPSGI